MTARPFDFALRIAALSTACLLQAPAQAGLVSGSWDPVFGDALPGLSWAVHAELLIPDNVCTNQVGNQTLTGPCADARLLGVFLRLYNTPEGAPDWNNPSAYFSSIPGAAAFAVCASSVSNNENFTNRCNNNFSNTYFDLRGLRLEGGSVAGLEASVLTSFLSAINLGGGVQQLPTSALGNQFSLEFTLNGPQLTCTTCAGGPVVSQNEGLRQFLVTYTSNDTSTPKFADASGNALGVRLDENGRVIGQATSIDAPLVGQVPEPGSLGLAGAALGALAATARLRRRRG